MNLVKIECLWGVNKKQIPNRIRGKSVRILQKYLAQQWWKSINGNNGPEILFKYFCTTPGAHTQSFSG